MRRGSLPQSLYTGPVIGGVSQLWQLTRELDLKGLRADFERSPRLRVIGSDRAIADQVAQLICPEAVGSALQVSTLGEHVWTTHEMRRAPADAHVVAIGSGLDADARRALQQIAATDTPLLLVQPADVGEVVVVGVPEEQCLTLPREDAASQDLLVSALLKLAPGALLALGRRCPSVRASVADHLIRDASRANGQLAALSSLPAAIPLVGGLVGDVADMLVLSKNQVLLILKLAGLYGRDVRLGRALIVEIVPVIGGAFFWRTTARSLIGLLPSVMSLVPKVLVAYTGTYVVGHMARYYYVHGRKPPREFVRGLAPEGMRLARAALARLLPGRRSAGAP